MGFFVRCTECCLASLRCTEYCLASLRCTECCLAMPDNIGTGLKILPDNIEKFSGRKKNVDKLFC